eukprot:476336-Lingulodinium_polyedra.AAC.1
MLLLLTRHTHPRYLLYATKLQHGALARAGWADVACHPARSERKHPLTSRGPPSLGACPRPVLRSPVLHDELAKVLHGPGGQALGAGHA